MRLSKSLIKMNSRKENVENAENRWHGISGIASATNATGIFHFQACMQDGTKIIVIL